MICSPEQGVILIFHFRCEMYTSQHWTETFDVYGPRMFRLSLLNIYILPRTANEALWVFLRFNVGNSKLTRSLFKTGKVQRGRESCDQQYISRSQTAVERQQKWKWASSVRMLQCQVVYSVTYMYLILRRQQSREIIKSHLSSYNIEHQLCVVGSLSQLGFCILCFCALKCALSYI